MTTQQITRCPHCGQSRDTSARYMSPANSARDQSWWDQEHLSGKCTSEESAPASPPGGTTRDTDQERFERALNRAADKVCDLAPHDERLADAINLVVNAALHLLEFPDDDLEEAVEANYSEPVDDVLGWVRTAR